MTSIQRINSDYTETLYREIYRRLGTVKRAAQAGKAAAFEETNRQIAKEASQHMDAMDYSRDENELATAFLAAGAWLAAR